MVSVWGQPQDSPYVRASVFFGYVVVNPVHAGLVQPVAAIVVLQEQVDRDGPTEVRLETIDGLAGGKILVQKRFRLDASPLRGLPGLNKNATPAQAPGRRTAVARSDSV